MMNRRRRLILGGRAADLCPEPRDRDLQQRCNLGLHHPDRLLEVLDGLRYLECRGMQRPTADGCQRWVSGREGSRRKGSWIVRWSWGSKRYACGWQW